MTAANSRYGDRVLSEGVVLSDRYRLSERLATGGMGDVWRGSDLLLGRDVAVKVLLPALVSDPDFIARFRAEARMLAALRHPGIVQVYDVGQDDLPDGRADYLVMEYVEGAPLSKRIEAAGALGVDETLSMLTQTATALHAAHLAGIVHRDVKPSNILVQPDGTIVLLDFGVARAASITSITSTNAIPGTALYMAPEQAAGRPVSAATDIYALGAVAYCCLTGGPPFTAENALQVAVRHLDDEPPPLPEEIPLPVAALVLRALAKEPDDRFGSAQALADAARALQRGDSSAETGAGAATAVIAPRAAAGAAGLSELSTAVLDPAPKRRRPQPALMMLAGTVLVAVLGLATALNLFEATPANPAPNLSPAPQSVPTAADPEPSGSAEDRPSGPLLPVEQPSSAAPEARPSPTPTLEASTVPSPSPEPQESNGTEPTPSESTPALPPTPAPSATPAPDASPDPGGGNSGPDGAAGG